MRRIIVAFLIAIKVCFSTVSNAQEPDSLHTIDAVDEIVKDFAAFRNNEALETFATVVGETTLMEKKRADDGFNIVKHYLDGKDDNFFDSLRKTFLFCLKKGNEHLMDQLKEFLKNDTFVEDWEVLLHCLPFTSDFRKEESGLIDILNELEVAKKPKRCKLWRSAPIFNHSKSYWQRRGGTREGKKYYVAMLKYQFVSAPLKKRGDLLKKAACCLGLGDLLEFEMFLRERFGTKYSLGDIDRLVLGPRVTSYADHIGHCLAVISGWFIKTQSGLFNNLPFDIWREALLYLDWRTLMYSMPYINKAMNKYITESRILSECPDLKRYLREKAQDCSPAYLYVFEHPWGAIYRTFPKFLTHYVLNNDSKPWINSLIDCLQSDETEYELLLRKLPLVGGKHPSGLSIDHLANIFGSIVESKSPELVPVFDGFPSQLTVALMGKVKNGQLITDFFKGPQSNLIMHVFYEAVLRAEELNWPGDMVEAVERKINEIFNFQISLPFNAEKIQKLAPEQLKPIITAFRDPLLTMKIVNALLQVDSELISILTLEDFRLILDCGLLSYPTAMTLKQFQTFIRRAIELHGEDYEFCYCLSRFITRITEHE